MENKTEKEYIRGFNLGYEIAKELNLKKPFFQGQDISQPTPDNPMHAGMFEYLREVALSRNKGQDLTADSKNIVEDQDNHKGKGLSR